MSNNIQQKIIIYISTCFKVGFFPKMPGTFGSLCAIIFLPIITQSVLIGASFILTMFIVGTWASSEYSNNDDPKEVVIDEVVGQLLTFYIVHLFTHITLFIGIISFITFRLFDIFKPWPICFLDKNIKGGLGIMLDDIMAAIMASISIIILARIL